MVDHVNPTEQFHPYAAPEATPAAQKPQTNVLSSILERAGISNASLGSLSKNVGGMDINAKVTQARAYARQNPGKVLGGLAAAVIGLGLLNGRRVR